MVGGLLKHQIDPYSIIAPLLGGLIQLFLGNVDTYTSYIACVVFFVATETCQEDMSSSRGDMKDPTESSEDMEGMDSNTRRSAIRNTHRVKEKLGASCCGCACIDIIGVRSSKLKSGF